MHVDFVIGSCGRLYEVERSFRMGKHDLQARPIFSHKRESIGAHLTVVFAAMAVAHWIETTTAWNINKVHQDQPPLPHYHHQRPPAPTR